MGLQRRILKSRIRSRVGDGKVVRERVWDIFIGIGISNQQQYPQRTESDVR